MGAPNKPRNRRAPPGRPEMARYGTKNAFKVLWDNPATRPAMLAKVRAAAKKGGRPEGVADGCTKEQIIALRAVATEKAERIITAMAKDDDELKPEAMTPDELEMLGLMKASGEAEGLVDDDKATARAVLKEAITIALMPGNRQTKLTAIRTVLEYTKAKPASTTNTNVNAAEEFLAALLVKGDK
jgi:hypothetical protein